MHQACLARREEASLAVVRLLLAGGANPDHKNRCGRSPRDMAHQRDETVAALFPELARQGEPSAAPDRPRK